MPIYDYRCEHCGHVFSAVQSFNDEALAKCPNCGKQPRRLITAPAIVFKGSGWYKTDSRPKSTSEGGTSETKDGPKTDTKSAKKSDTKPEAKADAKPDAKTETKPGASGKSEPAS